MLRLLVLLGLVVWQLVILHGAEASQKMFEDDVDFFTTQVNWDGGETSNGCTECSVSPQTTKMDTFACNKERWNSGKAGRWSDGKKYFDVGIKGNYKVLQVNVTLWGQFRCSTLSIGNYEPTIFSVSISDVSMTANPFQFPSCEFCDYCVVCQQCMVPLNLTGLVYSGGRPDWNTDSNWLEVDVEQGIVCISMANITIAYVKSSSDFWSGLSDLPLWGYIVFGLAVCFCCVFLGCVIASFASNITYATKQRKSSSLVSPGNDPRSNLLDYGTYSDESEGEFPDLKRISRPFSKQMAYKDIEMGERIGKGSFGEVFKGVCNGTEVAVKKLPYYFDELGDQKDQFLEDFIRETELMKSLHHPNIVQLYASFRKPEVCMVMEYMHRGSLYEILHGKKKQDLSWELLSKIMADAARGMTYLHNSEPIIVHRDLKSHNLLIDQHWTTKVSDFGLSRIMENNVLQQTMTSCGTPAWTAPEVLRGDKYTEKCDVYSYGVVLWECVTRDHPHQGLPHFQVVFRVGSNGLRPTIPENCPFVWSKLIKDCWQEDAANRPSFDKIVERFTEF